MKAIINAVLFVIVAVISAAVAASVAAANEEYVYCTYTEDNLDNEGQRVFYSAVFLADYSRATQFKLDFAKYVRKEFDAHKIGGRYCFFERDEAAAQRELERKVRGDKRLDFYEDFIMTGWRPHGADNSPLQDFNIAVCNPSDTAEICVWDYACEDGDEIEVEFNRRRIFRGELFTRQYCEAVSVDAGRSYRLELTALNETGGKGGCPNQVNTGAMSISSATTETQQWRHRGKTGSKIKVNVELDTSGKCAQNQPSNSSDDGSQSSASDASSDDDRQLPAPDYSSDDDRRLSGGAQRDPNLCEFANDGECDEPNFCELGTDGNDCN